MATRKREYVLSVLLLVYIV